MALQGLEARGEVARGGEDARVRGAQQPLARLERATQQRLRLRQLAAQEERRTERTE